MTQTLLTSINPTTTIPPHSLCWSKSPPSGENWAHELKYEGFWFHRSTRAVSSSNIYPDHPWRRAMLFMVVVRFRDNDAVPAYQHLREKGRSLPDGLEYVDSWVEPNFSRCFQLMECDDLKLFQQWALQWRESGVTFEIVPVVTSKETQQVVAPYLDSP